MTIRMIWQKAVSIVSAAVIIFSLFCSVNVAFGVSAAESTTEVFLDINGTFDTLNGWSYSNNGKVLSIDHAADAGHNENGALRFTYTSGWAFGESSADVDGVSVLAGTTYKIRYFLKTVNLLGATAYIHVFGYNAAGGGETLLASAVASKGLDGNASADWMEVTGEFTTGADTATVLIRFNLLTDSNWSAPATGSYVLMDDFTVSTEVTAPSMTEEYVSVNGTFDTLEGWTYSNSGKVLSIDHAVDAGHNANGALRFTYNSGWAFGETSADAAGVAVKPGTTYSIRYFLKTVNLLGATAYIHIFGYNAAGGGETLLASAVASKGLDGNASADWMEVTGEFTTGADTATVLIRFNLLTDSNWSAPATGSYVLVDDLTVSCEVQKEEPDPETTVSFNGTFDTLAGWTYSNSGKVLSIDHAADAGHSANGALRFTYNSGWAFGETSADIAGISVEANTTYQIEYYLRQYGLLGGSAYIHVFGRDANGNEKVLANTVAIRPLDGSVTDDWMQVLGEFTTAADTAEVVIRVNVLTDPGWSPPAAGSYLLIDDLTVFTEKSGEEPEQPEGPSSILDLNGDYDTLDGWSYNNNNQVLAIDHAADDGHDAAGALRFTYNSNLSDWKFGEAYAHTGRVAVKPDTAYSLSYFLKQYGLLGGAAYVHVFGFDADGNQVQQLSTLAIRPLDGSATDDWMWSTAEFTTSAQTVSLQVRFNVLTDDKATAPATGAYLLVDDLLVCVKGAEPETPVTNDGTLDGSFERVQDGKPVNWTAFAATNGFTVTSSDEAQDGEYSLKFTAISDALNSYQIVHSNEIAVEPDTTYEVSYYVRNVDLSGATGYASVMKNGSQFIGKEDLVRFDVTNGFGSDWKRVYTTFTTDSETTSVILRFTLAMWSKAPHRDATLYLDNFSLTEAVVDNNLNLGFESGLHNWKVSTDLYADIDTDVFHGGTQSLYLRKNDMSESKLTSLARIDAQLGQTLLFGGYVRSRNNINTKIRINLNCYDASGSCIKEDTSTRVMLGRAVPPNGDSQMSDWMRLMIAVPVPDDTVSVGFEIVVLEGQTELWVDDLFYRVCNLSADETLVDFSDLSYVDSDGEIESWSVGGDAALTVKGTSPDTYGELTVNGKGSMVYATDYLLSGNAYDIIFKEYTAPYDMKATVKYYDYNGEYLSGQDAVWTVPANTGADCTMTVTVPSSTSAKIYLTAERAGVYTLDKLDIIEVYNPDATQSWLGRWIWYPEDALTQAQYETRYFRHAFYLEALPTYAPLQISADDNFTLYVNGVEVGGNMGTGQDQWQAPITYDILRYLRQGENVIAIEVQNLVSYAGIVYDARVTTETGEIVQVCSNGAEITVSKTAVDDWMAPDFDDSDWIAPKEIGVMGSSPWGSLYFNTALYAENQIEFVSFEPQEYLYTASKAEIPAVIAIEEPLKGDFPFEVCIYRKNSTKQVTSAVLRIIEGKQPSEWTVGENKVVFEMDIPDYLETANYTLQLSDAYYYLTNEDVIDRQFATISVIASNEKAELPTSEIRVINGKPTVHVNGEARAPLFYCSPAADMWWDLEKETAYAEGTGTEFYVTNCTYLNKNGNKTEPIWVSEDTIDFDTFDRYIYEPLSANPDAMLIVAIGMQAPDWWLDQHPEEQIVIYDATTGTMRPSTTRAASFSSEAYRRDAGEVLQKLIEHMMNAPYASHIAGIKIQDGETQEYMTEGMTDWAIGDFSESSLAGFREYLKETYETEAALQEAYGDSTVTFESITVPDWVQRSLTWIDGATGILDPATNRWTIDYQYYLGLVATDTLLHYADIVKTISDNKLLAGAYHGYVWNFATSGAGSTHPAIEKVLAAPTVDFICSPFVYGERDIGENAAYDAMLDGVQAAGKLYLLEIDTRSVYEVATGNADWDADIGYCYTMKESIQSLKRDMGGLIAKGAGFWVFNMYGSWWYDQQMLSYIREVKTEMYYNTYIDSKTESDIALFVGEMNYSYFSPADVYGGYQTFYFLYNQQRRNLATIGAGYDTYHIRDLVNGNVCKDYKINVLLSPFEITPEEEAAIRSQLMKDDKIVVWIYLPGLSDGKANSLSNIHDLTGFDVKVLSNRGMQSGIMLGGHELTEGLEGFTYGNDLNSPADSAGPLPYLDLSSDTGATELATFGYDDTKTAMAMKDMGEWTSIYSTVMNLPSVFWRNLLDVTGGHIWSDNRSDIVHASGHYLSVYSLYGGNRMITLPSDEYSVYDVYEQMYLPVSGNSFTFTMEDNSARLFRLMSADKIAVLVRTSGGHASLDKLGVTEISPGEDFAVRAEVENGYYLAAVTVNGKEIDPAETVRLSDVTASTEIVFEIRQKKTYTVPDEMSQDPAPETPEIPTDTPENTPIAGNPVTDPKPAPPQEEVPSDQPEPPINDLPGDTPVDTIYVTETHIKWWLIALLVAGGVVGVALIGTLLEVFLVLIGKKKKDSKR